MLVDTEAKYNHQEIESRWREIWKKFRLDIADINHAQRPFYNLMMFPYPSAEGLHVGNMYAFTGSDIYGRFKRMQGHDVFEPIGLDGFGIHSENYALKIGRHPMDHAQITEKNFYDQLHKIGAMYDWSRTVETYDPGYYRFTQWLFVQMFKHGLAYREKAQVNWCPSCKTVLADEQVIEECCERCGNRVEKRLLEQWFFKITAYAEKLLENLASLDWSEKVKVAQRNWIGKKEGIEIEYPILGYSNTSINTNEMAEIKVFTTRPDTNFGATFVVIAPEHPFVVSLLSTKYQKSNINYEQITKYIETAKKKLKEERISQGRKKTGVFTGLYCLNQLNNYKMPLYISDFVVMTVGTGAVVGVPGHDRRDFEFAQEFKLPIKRVVVGDDGQTSEIAKPEQVQEGNGKMINSGFLNGLDIYEATKKMMDYLEKRGCGRRVTTYHLRDWLVSRQRYWGPPIPMIYCEKCVKDDKGQRKEMPGWYSVPEEQLPVILPRIEDYKPGNDGVAPLAKHQDFYRVACPSCGAVARRETDVSDTFFDSAWYFLRYPSIHTVRCGQAPFDQSITQKWLPVDMYTGGAEHSVLHLMYSRFITMALHDWGYLDFEEPFARFYAHGLVIKDGAKMSKSKGNIVNPDEYLVRYGADALRLYLMFMGPFDQGGDFRDGGMEGMSRWVGRVWRIAILNLTNPTNTKVTKALHRLIKKVTEDIEKRRYNTAIAAMMEFTNLVSDNGGQLGSEELKTFLKLLAPFAPFLTEELWQMCQSAEAARTISRVFSRSLADARTPSAQGSKLSKLPALDAKFQSVHRQPWPVFDPAQLEEESTTVIVQLNGKLRDSLTVSIVDSGNQSAVEALANQSPKVQKFLSGQPRKIIFVPGKLINFVC